MHFDYEALFEKSHGGISVLSGGRILHCNSAFAGLFGYTSEQMLSMSFSNLFHPEYAERMEVAIAGCLAMKEEPVRESLKGIAADGSEFWVDISLSLAEGVDGPAVLCFSRNITGCREAGLEKDRKLRRLETALDIANEGVWDWNVQTGEVYLNSTWFTMLGYEPDDFPQELDTWQNLVHPDDILTAKECQLSNCNEAYPLKTSFRMRTKSGEYKWINSRCRVVEKDSSGGTVRLIGVHEEFTERKEAEDALKESEERFKALSNASSGGILIHDNGIIIDCNSMLEKITGYSRDELIGMDGLMLVTESSRPVITRKMAEGYEKTYEVTGLRKNGEEYPLHLEGRNMPYKGRVARIVEFRDFTESHKVRREQMVLKSRLEALWHVSRMVEADYEALCDMMLSEAQSMTSSRFSFFGFVKDGRLELQISSREVMAECALDDKQPSIEIEDSSLWARVVNKMRPVIVNDYQKSSIARHTSPYGHVPILRVLLVPVVLHDKVAAIAAVANKEEDYTDDDASQLSAFVNNIMILIDRRRIEEELRNNEKKLHMAMEIASMGQWELDMEKKEFLFNDQFYSIYGTTAEAEGGMLMSAEDYGRNFIHPEDYELYSGEIERIANNEYAHSTAQVENRIIRRDGEVRNIVVRFTVLGDGSGKNNRVLGVNQDITELRRTEEEVVAQRRRLSDIIRGTNIGTWEWNVQTGKTVFNARWAGIIGYTLEEISPTTVDTWMSFCHPDDLDASKELLNRHFNGELDQYEYEVRMKHKEGHWVWVLTRGRVASWTKDGKPLLMSGTHQDITERKEREEKIRYLATHDSLTGLPSLRLARDRIEQAVFSARRKNMLSAICFVDLDGFKSVNDTLGHDAGDAVLIETGERLKSCVREVDTVARIGGDEFLVVLCELKEKDDAGMVAGKMIEAVRKPYSYKGNEVQVGASVGISIWSPEMDETDAEELLKKADSAMYAIKKFGKNGYAYADDMETEESGK